MEKYRIPLLDESGRTIGYGDRWWSHRVRVGPDGPILGQKHTGITIACLDDNMNEKNAYELRWADLAEISKDSRADLKREPIRRKYAPWVSAVFSLPSRETEEAFQVG